MPSVQVRTWKRDYLKQLLDRYHGDRRLAMGAYNTGPNRVDNAGGIPDIPETINYVSRIRVELSDEEAADGAGPDLRARSRCRPRRLLCRFRQTP